MSVTVADVLLHGRDIHPAFGRKWTGDGVLLRFLTRYQQDLLLRLAQMKRDAVQRTFRVSIPSEAAWESGKAVPESLVIHAASVVFEVEDRRPEKLDIVEFSQRLEDRVWGAYFQNQFMHLMGDRADWNAVDHIDLFYFPVGDDLTARTSEFVLPGQPRNVLTHGAALFLGQRAVAMQEAVTVDLGALAAEKRDAEETWFDQVTNRRRAIVSVAKDTF